MNALRTLLRALLIMVVIGAFVVDAAQAAPERAPAPLARER